MFCNQGIEDTNHLSIPLLTNVFVIRVLKILITYRYYKCLCNQGIEDTSLIGVLFFATRRAILAITVITILQIYGLSRLGNQSHLYLYAHRTCIYMRTTSVSICAPHLYLYAHRTCISMGIAHGVLYYRPHHRI